jgi:rhodanese-related sulfurtransferase
VIKKFIYLFFLTLLFCIFTFGCVRNQGTDKHPEKSPSAMQTKVYQGKILQKLNRSQIIRIQITENNHSKTIAIPFGHRTKGLEYVVRGKQVILTCKVTDGRDKAVSIEPGETGYADGISGISAGDLKKMLDTKEEFALIDTRPTREYEASHLPTAISVPGCARDGHRTLSSIDKDVPLVFYCGWPECNRSIAQSAFAADAGYQDIKVLEKGLQGWVKAGYATIADDAFIRRGDCILLDLRAARKDTVQRIPGSISIPLPTLADRAGDIPPDAPVVVYSEKFRDSLGALTILRSAGFTQTAMVEGNFSGWQQRSNSVISGPIVTTIRWTRNQEQGEVSIADFIAAQKGGNNVVILDVRTNKEVALGRIDNSIHIPLGELTKRMDELPKDKIIYCAVGPRADIASRELKENGYTSLFLVAELDCNKKKCRIKK